MSLKFLVLLLAVGILGFGCTSKEEEKVAEKEPAVQDPYPASGPHGSAPGEESMARTLTLQEVKSDPLSLKVSDIVSGEITEVKEIKGYTLINLKDQSTTFWAAVVMPPGELKPGRKVDITRATVMSDFYSKSLDKTFDKIIFGQVIREGGLSGMTEIQLPSAGSPQGDGGMAGTGGMPSAGGMPGTGGMRDMGPGSPGHGAAAKSPADIKVAKASGPDAYTVEELFSRKSELKDKNVVVRGMVVKYNSGILSRNWIHLQDGTGSTGQNDLTITTASQSKVGDTVLVRGALHLDKDIGAGYAYDLIIEDAEITVE